LKLERFRSWIEVQPSQHLQQSRQKEQQPGNKHDHRDQCQEQDGSPWMLFVTLFRDSSVVIFLCMNSLNGGACRGAGFSRGMLISLIMEAVNVSHFELS